MEYHLLQSHESPKCKKIYKHNNFKSLEPSIYAMFPNVCLLNSICKAFKSPPKTKQPPPKRRAYICLKIVHSNHCAHGHSIHFAPKKTCCASNGGRRGLDEPFTHSRLLLNTTYKYYTLAMSVLCNIVLNASSPPLAFELIN